MIPAAHLFVVERLARPADGEGGDLVGPEEVQPLLAGRVRRISGRRVARISMS
jgi:hypothetical protein